MIASLRAHLQLSDDELMVLASRAGVQTLPVVLGVRPRHGTASELAAATQAATAALIDRELLFDDAVADELVGPLWALERPDRELAMRLVTPEGTARVTVVRRGKLWVWARRVGNVVALHLGTGRPVLTEAIKPLLHHLPAAPPADVAAFGAPLHAVSDALTGTHDAARLADQLAAIGAPARTAMMFGSALGSRLAFAEIVCYALSFEADRLLRGPAPVGVFCTRRGRIVAAPSVSPSGQLWTTLKGGSDNAIKQALSQLVEISAEGWEED
ncbi:hypothetical protein A5692_07900 [Mycobacterium sp. E342]|uniref:ESX secretion-associated protein EspG n=1 Tax=Mycobacterium sp. E342 TaxID=1834147 RepID=UPI0007FE4546|nr:ESX secretion-associated protein EspG [Mycobacterium sp. E342]OBH39499.1 hypothetical protein A5692_07900 [Mycobacterium sp. E342]